MTAAWEVQVTQTALQDLREAARYMRDALGSPAAAREFVDAFSEQVALLEVFPAGRPLVRDYELAQAGYRWCSVGSFMLFYTLDEGRRQVFVERLLYGARDWKSLL